MSPIEVIFVTFPPKTGTNMLHPPPPPPDRCFIVGTIVHDQVLVYTNHTILYSPARSIEHGVRMSRPTETQKQKTDTANLLFRFRYIN